MKRRILILSLFGVMLIGGCGSTNTGNGNDKTSVEKESTENTSNDNKESEEEQIGEVAESGEFDFLYDYNSISNEWWSQPNEFFGEILGWSNADRIAASAKIPIGVLDGELHNRPMDFSFAVDFNGDKDNPDYYKISIENNSFAFFSYVKALDVEEEDIAFIYIPGNDLCFYNANIEIVPTPTNVELKQGEWNALDGHGIAFNDTLYLYQVNERYSVGVSAYSGLLDKVENVSDREAMVKQLLEHIVNLIKIEKLDGTEYDTNVRIDSFDQIEVSDTVSFNIKDLPVVEWFSGPESGDRISEGHSTIIYKNYRDEDCFITEETEKTLDDIMAENLKSESVGYEYEDVEYNGLPIKVEIVTLGGKKMLSGVYFTVDNKVYGIIEKMPNGDDSLDTWLHGLLDNVLIVK